MLPYCWCPVPNPTLELVGPQNKHHLCKHNKLKPHSSSMFQLKFIGASVDWVKFSFMSLVWKPSLSAPHICPFCDIIQILHAYKSCVSKTILCFLRAKTGKMLSWNLLSPSLLGLGLAKGHPRDSNRIATEKLTTQGLTFIALFSLVILSSPPNCVIILGDIRVHEADLDLISHTLSLSPLTFPTTITPLTGFT